jgi:predicted alpha/beta superfamily hydrolase
MIQYPALINPVETITKDIFSNHVQQDYRLFISLPPTYAESQAAFPVLYLLDGNALFLMVKPMVEMLQLFDNVPEMIIVAIGYPKATYMETLGLRGRDLTPIELSDEEKAQDAYPFAETGGAAQFLSFIKEELVPMIDREFRTIQTDRTLAGFSLGATFALYAMFGTAQLFQRIIAVSAGIDSIVEIEKQYSQKHDSLPIKLNLSMEHPEDKPAFNEWLQNVKTFIEQISNRYTNLEARFRVFEGIDHSQVGSVGFAYALKDIYAK